MSYYDYSDYEPEENIGNSGKKWDTQQDTNIIKSVMSLPIMTTILKENSGEITDWSYKRETVGATTSAKMEISFVTRMITWESTDSENFGNCKISYYHKDANNPIEPLLLLWTTKAELEKPTSRDGCV